MRELYVVTADHNSKTSEISVERGQLVEVLSKPPGSKSWRIRQLGDVLQEGFVPFSILRKQEDENGISKNGKRNSVETLNSHSSEGKSFFEVSSSFFKLYVFIRSIQSTQLFKRLGKFYAGFLKPKKVYCFI